MKTISEKESISKEGKDNDKLKKNIVKLSKEMAKEK